MVIGGTGILNAVPNHDRSRPDTYLCQRDPAAVSGPSPGLDPGTSPLFEIITKTPLKTVRRPMPVFFRTDQGAKFLRSTIYMAESTLFAHLYATRKVPWHCALTSLAPEDDMTAKKITYHRSQPIQPRRSRLLLRSELTTQRIARQVPTSMARLGPK